MIRTEFRIDGKLFDAQITSLGGAGTRMARAWRRDMRPLAEESITRLSTEPPRWRGKRRWNSDRQRRKVMAMLREQGNLPYRRTHQLAQKWRAFVSANPQGGVFRVENASDKARFVQGQLAQLMHLDSGWPQLDATAEDLRPRALRQTALTWFRVSSPFRGEPG